MLWAEMKENFAGQDNSCRTMQVFQGKLSSMGAKTLVLLLPFILFYWFIPFLGKLTIGNDYINYPIQQQLELQYSIEHGSFPLYVPGFAGGRSAAALTLGQIYHPISWLARLLPTYWDGNALELVTLWRLISLGLVHLMLFLLLRKLQIPGTPAFLLSLITVYNLRMLDMFRYGASLENYTGYLLFCSIAALYYLKPTKFTGPAGMIASAYLMVCGGHPQIMYLCLLGAVFAIIIMPFCLDDILGPDHQPAATRQRFWITASLGLVTGILLSSPYILPFYFEFVRDNSQRTNQGYEQSLAYSDSWGGALNGFFQPLRSEVTGAFGSSALILLAPLAPLLALFRIKLPKSIFVLWLGLALIFVCALGSFTPLHYLVWKYLPFADAFRVPGRFNILLPWPVMLLLVWLVRQVQTIPPLRCRDFAVHPVAVLATVSAILFLVYNLFVIDAVPAPPMFFPRQIHSYPQWIDTLVWTSGFASLALLAAWVGRERWRPVLGLLLAICVIIQIQAELRYGTWVVPKKPTPTLQYLDRYKKQNLSFWGAPGYGMASPRVMKQIDRSALDPFLARLYRAYTIVPNEEQAYRFLATDRRAQTAVIVKEHTSDAAPPDKETLSDRRADTIRLDKSTFNELILHANSFANGVLCLAYPFSRQWRAFIDGVQVPVYPANGYEIGIEVPPGKHEIAFRFWSWATCAGLIVSCATLAAVGVFFVHAQRTGRKRFFVLAGGIILPLAILILWYQSLYNGVDLHTRYQWTTDSFPPENNIAYAKRTRMSSIQQDQMPYFYSASLAVDGDRYGLPFTTAPSEVNPWWEVDLGRDRKIDYLLIYHGSRVMAAQFPLLIGVSDDGKTYRVVSIIPAGAGKQKAPWKIPLQGVQARFLRIQTSGQGSFSLTEVEVYPL